jgi:hypothetical protein
MAADEIQAAIDRAEAKRRELEEQEPAAKPSSSLFTMLPQAAEAYRRRQPKGWQATRAQHSRHECCLKNYSAEKSGRSRMIRAGSSRTGICTQPRFCAA